LYDLIEFHHGFVTKKTKMHVAIGPLQLATEILFVLQLMFKRRHGVPPCQTLLV
jgi:hypothetical protein